MVDERMEADGGSEPRHPIGIVARRTGLSVDVLRAWERRYDAVTPTRGENGRRLYSDADVERLRLLRSATEAGRSIGQVVELDTDELAALIAEDGAAGSVSHPDDGAGEPVSPMAGNYLRLAQEAVEKLASSRLEGILMRALVAESAESFIEGVAAPLIAWLGDGWQDGTLTVAHEHMASAVLRRVLGVIGDSSETPASAPEVVVATPSGQVHEFGALLVAATMASQGWRVTYLGPDLPAADISFAARQNRAACIAVSITVPHDDAVRVELLKLWRGMPPGVGLVVGGAAAARYAELLDEMGAEHLSSLAELRAFARDRAPVRPR